MFADGNSSHVFVFSLCPCELELSSEMVKGAKRTDPLRGLFSVTRSALSQSSGGMFLRLLLGSEQLSSAGYGLLNQQGELMSFFNILI